MKINDNIEWVIRQIFLESGDAPTVLNIRNRLLLEGPSVDADTIRAYLDARAARQAVEQQTKAIILEYVRQAYKYRGYILTQLDAFTRWVCADERVFRLQQSGLATEQISQWICDVLGF